jgi:phosphatidylethanolamine-binding protein (PEBP) family uncharacterized protein
MIGRILRPFRAGEGHLAWNSRVAADAPTTISVRSSSFEPGGPIPARDAGPGVGENISPELSWSDGPAEAVELLLIAEDRSAPLPRPVVHGLAILPASQQQIPEGHLRSGDGVRMGLNFSRHTAFSGPRPLSGHGPHTYVFQVFALDRPLAVPGGFTKRQALQAAAGSVVARGRLDGIYER